MNLNRQYLATTFLHLAPVATAIFPTAPEHSIPSSQTDVVSSVRSGSEEEEEGPKSELLDLTNAN